MSLATPSGSSGTSFLQYTGIPPSWLKKRPKLPSRNWLIFLSTSATIASLYAYDRKKCKQIRTEYIDKVKHLAEDPLPSLALPRKVTVYGSKWPGDEDADRSMKYFRKYVKPILVAAAVDYEMINGKRHGTLADTIADKVKSRRRLDLGLDSPPPLIALPIPGQGIEEQRKRELEGGIVIVGRQTFKEFMHGLKRGWTEPLDLVDKEELLAQELQSDGVFDEVDINDSNAELQDGSPSSSDVNHDPQAHGGSHFYPPPGISAPLIRNTPRTQTNIDPRLNTIPATIPTYPPILLVRFTNLIGLSLIPRMIWDFFNQREKVREGAEAAVRLVTSIPRPIHGPSSPFENHTDGVEHNQSSDLSFDIEAETYYKPSAVASDIEKARVSYYEALPAKIKTARELARGEREPTKDEKSYPPPTEVELRTERMNKELRWRGDLSGWQIVNPVAPVAWDPRFVSALSVYVDKDQGKEQDIRSP